MNTLLLAASILYSVVTGYVKQECLAAKDDDSFKTLNQISNRKDEQALTAGMLAGKYFVVPKDTKISVLNGGFLSSKVRLESGRLKGRTVVIDNEYISTQ